MMGAFVVWGSMGSTEQYSAPNQLVACHDPKCTLTVSASPDALVQTVHRAPLLLHSISTRPQEQMHPG